MNLREIHERLGHLVEGLRGGDTQLVLADLVTLRRLVADALEPPIGVVGDDGRRRLPAGYRSEVRLVAGRVQVTVTMIGPGAGALGRSVIGDLAILFRGASK